MVELSGKVYPPVGECIYCGATSVDAKLCDEHIVPFALGGSALLPASSCESCTAITGAFEQRVLRGGLRGIKERLALPSRTKSRPKKLPLFCVNGDEGRKVDVQVEHYPALVILPHLVGPQIATFAGRPAQQRPPWLYFPQPDMDTLVERYGIERFASNSMDTHSFARMLAKIAHAGAIGEIGPGKFFSYLPHVILNDLGHRYLSLIGTIEGPSEEDGGPVRHTWRFFKESAGGRTYLTCQLRLFANFGAPAYRIVIGHLVEDCDPLGGDPVVEGTIHVDDHTKFWRLDVAAKHAADASYSPLSPTSPTGKLG